MADPKKERQPSRPQKKPWQPPRVKTGQLFESNSLACGKNSPATEECGVQHPTQS